MFANTYQSGFLSILYGGGAKPLSIWCQKVKNGHIRRVTDEDVQTLAVELMGTNVATTYIICPDNPKHTLGIRLPFFVMIVKNMKKYFTFEITILGSSYIETLRVQIHANVRIRRIYFSDRLYAEDEMPAEFKLYVPIATTRKRPMVPPKQVEDKGTGREVLPEPPPQEGEEQIIEGDIIPSGAPPSPMESPHADEAAAAAAAAAAAGGSKTGMVGEEGEKLAEGMAEGEETPAGETAAEDQSEVPSELPTDDTEAPAEGAEPVAEAPAEEVPSEVPEASEVPSEAPSEAPAEEAEAAPTE